jgi:DNA-dependent RNA polymerase auxiliary subunit epsilon
MKDILKSLQWFIDNCPDTAIFNKQKILARKSIKNLIVNSKGRYIKYIKNPSKEIQLLAVKQNGYNIDYINNPSKGVQLVAVKQNPYNIRFIKNPPEEVQLAAVEDYVYNIQYIKNPTKLVQLEAVKRRQDILNNLTDYIKNPCQEIKDMLIIKDIIE